jgi:rare lipoprotein A
VDYKKYLLVIILFITGFTPIAAQSHRGKASYYSKRATGAKTASGERLHHDSLTCAHRTYPFGTLLKVTNLANDREVVVRVTDRGPFVRGRIIDLSYGAAQQLGMLAQGIGIVKVERIEGLKPPYRIEDAERGIPNIDFDMCDFAKGTIDEMDRIPDNEDEQIYPNTERPIIISKANVKKHFTKNGRDKKNTVHLKDNKKTTNKISNTKVLKNNHQTKKNKGKA